MAQILKDITPAQLLWYERDAQKHPWLSDITVTNQKRAYQFTGKKIRTIKQ